MQDLPHLSGSAESWVMIRKDGHWQVARRADPDGTDTR